MATTAWVLKRTLCRDAERMQTSGRTTFMQPIRRDYRRVDLRPTLQLYLGHGNVPEYAATLHHDAQNRQTNGKPSRCHLVKDHRAVLQWRRNGCRPARLPSGENPASLLTLPDRGIENGLVSVFAAKKSYGVRLFCWLILRCLDFRHYIIEVWREWQTVLSVRL